MRFWASQFLPGKSIAQAKSFAVDTSCAAGSERQTLFIKDDTSSEPEGSLTLNLSHLEISSRGATIYRAN